MKKMNRVYRKNMSKLLAGAAALCLVLVNTGASTILAENTAVESAESLAPGSISIQEPIALDEISLPESSYGIFSWADGSYVPQSSQEYCPVIFTPYDAQAYAGTEGYDPESGTVTIYVEICVLGVQGEDEFTEAEDTETPSDAENQEPAQGDDTSGEEKNPQEEGESLPAPTGMPQEEQEEKEVTPVPSQTPPESPSPQVTQEPQDGSEDTDSQNPQESKDPQASPKPSQTVTPPADQETDPPQEEGLPGEGQDGMPEDGAQETPQGELSLEEQQAMASQNHTSQGITVTGDYLPWYVKFLVSSGEEYTFGNAEDANFFQSYEFELWDTLNDTEYIIPDGQYVVVTVPVLEGYDYVIEHLLDNGAVETIIPCVNGDTMIFATHSFSPFGIAGSKPLVGSDIAENGYSEGDSTQSTGSESKADPGATTAPQAQTTAAPENNSAIQPQDGSQVQTQAPADTAASSGQAQVSTQPQTNSQTNSQQAVNTGDDTKILPLVILLAAAIVIIGAVLVVLKKKK